MTLSLVASLKLSSRWPKRCREMGWGGMTEKAVFTACEMPGFAPSPKALARPQQAGGTTAELAGYPFQCKHAGSSCRRDCRHRTR